MTPEELRLWRALKEEIPWKFRRQEPIDHYIVDFVCYPKRFIVEVDGEQHAESEADRTRDAELRKLGFLVHRVWNSDVQFRLEGVLEEIEEMLRVRIDHHPARRARGS